MFKALLALGFLWILTLSPQDEKQIINEYVDETGHEVVIFKMDGRTYSTTYLTGGDSITIELNQ